MRKMRSFLIGCITLACTAAQLQAQETAVDEEELMKRWEAFMTPGDNHALLKKREGNWELTIKMWMDPSAPPTVSTGTSVVKMIMGDRYLVDHTKSTFNGMPFEGMAIVGYDNMQKKFVSNWIDNMGTGFLLGYGTYDESTKTFTYEMMGPDLMSGKYEKMRSVEKIISDDQWVTEMVRVMPDGKEIKSMEVTYKRAG